MTNVMPSAVVDAVRSSSFDLDAAPPPESGPYKWEWSRRLASVRRWRMLVGGFVLAVTVLSALYNRSLPDVYTATAALLPPASANAGALAKAPWNLLSMAGAALPTQALTGTELYPEILHSESVILPLLAKPFPTSEASGPASVTLAQIVQTDNPQIGIRRVRKLVKVAIQRPTSICGVSVTLEDPVTAAAVCNAFVSALAARSITLRTTGAASLRQFVSGRLEEVKKELLDAEQELQDFRTRNRNFGYASSPDLQVADVRLSRQVSLKSQLHLQLSQEYEMARIEEKRDVADVQILDSAMVPTVKSGPNRIRSTFLAGVSAFPLAVMLLLTWQHVFSAAGRRMTPPEQQSTPV